jgi:hypothetical protein
MQEYTTACKQIDFKKKHVFEARLDYLLTLGGNQAECLVGIEW